MSVQPVFFFFFPPPQSEIAEGKKQKGVAFDPLFRLHAHFSSPPPFSFAFRASARKASYFSLGDKDAPLPPLHTKKNETRTRTAVAPVEDERPFLARERRGVDLALVDGFGGAPGEEPDPLGLDRGGGGLRRCRGDVRGDAGLGLWVCFLFGAGGFLAGAVAAARLFFFFVVVVVAVVVTIRDCARRRSGRCCSFHSAFSEQKALRSSNSSSSNPARRRRGCEQEGEGRRGRRGGSSSGVVGSGQHSRRIFVAPSLLLLFAAAVVGPARPALRVSRAEKQQCDR